MEKTNLSIYTYGIPASEAEANNMIQTFMRIETDFATRLQDIVKTPSGATSAEEAQRFFCGQDCMYVFSVSQIRHLVSKINDKDVIVIYHGSREDKDKSEEEGKINLGRPTLILSVYTQDNEGLLTFKKDPAGAGYDVLEHPGGDHKLLPDRINKPGTHDYGVLNAIDPDTIAHAIL